MDGLGITMQGFSSGNQRREGDSQGRSKLFAADHLRASGHKVAVR